MWADGADLRAEFVERSAARCPRGTALGPRAGALGVLVRGRDRLSTPRGQLATDLDILGGTPDGVAATLWYMGADGDQCNSGTCPVAAYLMARGWESVEVNEYYAAVRHGPIVFDRGLPGPIIGFIHRFDRGGWTAFAPTLPLSPPPTNQPEGDAS